MTEQEKLEEAKRLYTTANADQKYVLESLFPELKESEDERIRKELIEFTKTRGGFKQEWIAWLEKQGMSYTKRDVDDAYLEGMVCAKNELEKQGEQKPIVIIPKFRVGDNIKTTNEEPLTITKIDDKGYWSEDLFICGFDNTAKWELVEQKPAWSEEDERTIHNIDAAIRHGVVFPIDELKSMKIWLESLKYRIRPKHEWKKDEKTFQLIEDVIDVYRKTQGSVIGGVHTEELKDYLKSIKERYTWKPSIAQLNALSIVSKGNAPDDIEAIVSLYNDLKKLREE